MQFNRNMMVVATALTAIFTVGAKSAHAQQFTLKSNTSASQNVTITNNGVSHGTSTGTYNATLGSTNIVVFCADATHSIGFGQGYTANTTQLLTNASGTKVGSYYNGGLSSVLTNGDYGVTVTAPEAQKRSNEVAYLASTYINGTSDQQAASSLAIWDIAQDGGNGLRTGSFQASGYSANVGTLFAQFELDALKFANVTNSNVYWIQAPRDANNGHLQDFIGVYTGGNGGSNPFATTPEASDVAFAVVFGAGLMGLIVRARRRNA